MKPKILLVAIVTALAGCSTPSIQKLLTASLPPSFSGNVSIEHKNPYFRFDLKVGNLRKGAGGLWEYDWLVLDRGGFSHGKTVIGTPPE